MHVLDENRVIHLIDAPQAGTESQLRFRELIEKYPDEEAQTAIRAFSLLANVAGRAFHEVRFRDQMSIHQGVTRMNMSTGETSPVSVLRPEQDGYFERWIGVDRVVLNGGVEKLAVKELSLVRNAVYRRRNRFEKVAARYLVSCSQLGKPPAGFDWNGIGGNLQREVEAQTTVLFWNIIRIGHRLSAALGFPFDFEQAEGNIRRKGLFDFGYKATYGGLDHLTRSLPVQGLDPDEALTTAYEMRDAVPYYFDIDGAEWHKYVDAMFRDLNIKVDPNERAVFD